MVLWFRETTVQCVADDAKLLILCFIAPELSYLCWIKKKNQCTPFSHPPFKSGTTAAGPFPLRISSQTSERLYVCSLRWSCCLLGRTWAPHFNSAVSFSFAESSCMFCVLAQVWYLCSLRIQLWKVDAVENPLQRILSPPRSWRPSGLLCLKPSGKQNTSSEKQITAGERTFGREQLCVLGGNSHLQPQAFGPAFKTLRLMHESAIKTAIMAETTRGLVKLSAWQLWLSRALLPQKRPVRV